MDIGDRMKLYEGMETGRILMPSLPICIRLDGRAFHTFCKGLEKPFDKGFRDLMAEVTKALVNECGAYAKIGYTQSDEISLVLWNDNPQQQPYFGGRVQKICSSLASLCSVTFNRLLPQYLPHFAEKGKVGMFDCRVWNVPTLAEAANVILWREQDATKNSISSAAQSMFSHKFLQGLDGKQMQELMFKSEGVNWNDYPAYFKRGTYVTRITTDAPFTAADIEALPPKHAARTNPDLVVSRSVIAVKDFGYPLGSIANRVGVLFDGEDPIILKPTEPTTPSEVTPS